MYLAESRRKQAEAGFVGASESFLASLELAVSFRAAERSDLERAHELTVRTHQLNSTGRTYSFEQLAGFILSATHDLVIVGLEDKYGAYGKIGLALIEKVTDVWTLKLLLMSCRVLSKGIGSVFLKYIMIRARESNVRLRAEFVRTERNRIMYITYKFAGFREVASSDELIVLENNLDEVPPIPDYIRVDPQW